MKVDVGARHSAAPNSLVDRIADVRQHLAEQCRSVGRDPVSVQVLAVTKGQPRDRVLAAIDAGVHDVGENYVQEARTKYAGVAGVCRHFIGHVQTNKAKAIVELFDVVQSIDRIEAGLAIAKASRAVGKGVRTLVQVNISPSERYGVPPEEAVGVAARLRAEGLDVDGIMAIGPLTPDRAAVLRAFTSAQQVFQRVGGSTLSLGMSGDWREAVACGSTMVRLGTALFGPRARRTSEPSSPRTSGGTPI